MWWREKAERSERQVLRCTFCRKHKDDVTRLIAGPKVFICDECVEVCNDIIADDKRIAKQTGDNADRPTNDGAVAWPNAIECALCRVPIAANEGVVVGGNRGILCADCVVAVQSASASDR
jgi:ATP-dependent protease Clp ATPase subunit